MTGMNSSTSTRVDGTADITLTSLSFDELIDWCTSRGYPAFRAHQLWQWTYRRLATAYGDMTNLPDHMRNAMPDALPLASTRMHASHSAEDGSVKYVIALADGALIECVWIPMVGHATVCVSSQVGCAIGCTFCASGADGLVRNLAAHEIVEQVLLLARSHSRDSIGNVVVMGAG